MVISINVASVAHAEQYSFVALGDTSYDIPGDYPVYLSLIHSINAVKAKFSIHVGDTKGAGDCGDEFQLRQKEFFETFEQPLIYTFGNNEWADCWKDNRGKHDPLVVLRSMRKIFFAENASLGKNQTPLIRQADLAPTEFSDYVENVRWSTEEVTYSTLHVVGEHNNQFLREEPLWREFVAREKANLAWINAAFESAAGAGHKALVISMHSNIFGDLAQMDGSAFQPVLSAISANAETFDGQVLVIHGHEHTFIIDRPMHKWDSAETTISGSNITRLEVFGWPDMKAVRVSVDTSTPWVFGFEPVYGEPSLTPSYDD
jgi:hypothetical protein